MGEKGARFVIPPKQTFPREREGLLFIANNGPGSNFRTITIFRQKKVIVLKSYFLLKFPKII